MGLLLFKICRELRDEYCLSFNENGYDKHFEEFDSKKMIDRVAEILKERNCKID